jgi:hypothetical protein
MSDLKNSSIVALAEEDRGIIKLKSDSSIVTDGCITQHYY